MQKWRRKRRLQYGLRRIQTQRLTAAVLGDLISATIIAYERLAVSETGTMCDAVTLSDLIATHDLTFSHRLVATLTGLTSGFGTCCA